MELGKQTTKKTLLASLNRNYNEIVEYLDKNWSTDYNIKTFEQIVKIDRALGVPSKKINAIIIGGTNGKSLTIHFASKLFQAEGLNVGSFYSPHFLSYNERFLINDEQISNKNFTELANEIINIAESLKFKLSSLEILTLMAFKFFSNADVVLLESNIIGKYNPINICTSKIFGVTRVSCNEDGVDKLLIENVLETVSKNVYFVSADQSKLNLNIMEQIVKDKGGNWTMPVRKVAQLEYPFEQLHGRCAALAERIAQIYMNDFIEPEVKTISGSLLTKPKTNRGRPTLEAKRQAELNPKTTLNQFWKDFTGILPGRFQILSKEKPTIILDSASNIDALNNLLLGVRLLHYQKPLKGLALVVACYKNQMKKNDFSRAIRYFFKKTSGQIVLCPILNNIPGQIYDESWDVEDVANELRNMKVKVKTAKSFSEAISSAKKFVDERNGLLVITGSQAIISAYWNSKEIKKI